MMIRFALRFLLAFVMYVTSFSPAQAQNCAIVYGDNWAFLTETPQNWSSTCGEDRVQGTALSLLPVESDSARMAAFMYVSVAVEESPNVHEFAMAEQTRFKRNAPAMQVIADEKRDIKTNFPSEIVHVQLTPGGRNELIAYIQGPSAYYIVVLTAREMASLAKYEDDFYTFLGTFVPMARSQLRIMQ